MTNTNIGIYSMQKSLELLRISDNAAFEATHEKNGLFLKPLSASEVYRKIAQKHRKPVSKLAK
jgi:hypothetical protein